MGQIIFVKKFVDYLKNFADISREKNCQYFRSNPELEFHLLLKK